MSAEVVILNARAVAMAADSAVTLFGGGKIRNTAEKLLKLLDSPPIGALIHGSASICGIPVQNILSNFADQCRSSLPEPVTVHQLGDRLMNAIASELVPAEWKRSYYEQALRFWVTQATQKAKATPGWDDSHPDISAIGRAIDQLSAAKQASADVAHPLALDALIGLHRQRLESEPTIQVEIRDNLARLLAFVDAKVGHAEPVGICLAGFGTKAVSPSVVSYHIFSMLPNGELPYVEKARSSVSPDCPAIVQRLAQDDEIRSFFEGIHPRVRVVVQHAIRAALNNVLTAAPMPGLGSVPADQINVFAGHVSTIVDSQLKAFTETGFTQPILNQIAHLDKLDLARTAEALIEITALRRRISDQKETVGGPVDVAIITKTDGFVWIKSKDGTSKSGLPSSE